MLKKLLAAIKEGAIPERLMRLLHIFQTFGNLVAHPQGIEESSISDEVARSMIVLYVYADDVIGSWLVRQNGPREIEK